MSAYTNMLLRGLMMTGLFAAGLASVLTHPDTLTRVLFAAAAVSYVVYVFYLGAEFGAERVMRKVKR